MSPNISNEKKKNNPIIRDEKNILGNLYTKILLKIKKFLLLEKIYKVIALNHDAIEVEIGIIINPTFWNNATLITIFNITETKEI